MPAPDERVDPELVQELPRRRAVGETYGFVMFHGRITTEKRRTFERLGVTPGSHALLGGTPPGWDAGRFEAISDSSIRVFPPHALPPRAFAVSVLDRLCGSSCLQVSLVANRNPTLGVPAAVPAGTAFRAFVAGGATSPQAVIGLAASPFDQPAILPGVIQLGIGQEFAWLLIFPDTKLADPANRAATWTVPSVRSVAFQ